MNPEDDIPGLGELLSMGFGKMLLPAQRYDDIIQQPGVSIGVMPPTRPRSTGNILADAVQLELPLKTPPAPPIRPQSNWRDLQPETGYIYHATNLPNAQSIAQEGRLRTFPPDYGTDQSEWPDRSVANRSYWTPHPGAAALFPPEGGEATLLRAKLNDMFRRERGTSDWFLENELTDPLEYYSQQGWRRLR